IGSSGTYNHKWYIDGTEIPGETTTTLNLDATAISSLGVGTHTVVIEVTDPSSPLSCSETASVQLTINDVPEVTITGPSELCEGSSVTYTANVTGSGSYTYPWQLDGVDIPGATGATLSYDASGFLSVGSHTISVIVVDNSYTAHCTSSASLLLEVYDTPVVTIDEGDQSVCEDGSVSFTANATGSGALNYKWSIDGTELIGETGSVLNLDAVALSGLSIGDHTVTVEVTDTSSPLSCSASASAQLTINEIPSLSPIPAQTVCEDAANAIFIADDLGSGYSYEWSYNGHVISGETGTSLTIENSNFPPVGDTYPVSVTVTNNLTGCFTVINTNLSVNSLPTVNLDDASTCDGQDITITATASGGSGNYVNYIWYDELGNVISSGPSNELTLTGSDVELANNGATFSVVVEDDNGCQSAPDDMTLTVNENPTVTINSGETSKDICGGAELKLEAYATGGSGTSYSYEWLLPNGTTMTGNEITIPSVLFSEHNGTYSVTVSDDATSCSATAQIEVNVIEITPVLDASATSVCENDKEITFTASGGEQYEFFRFDSQAGTWSSVQGPDTQNILVTDELNDGDRVYVEVYENGCSALSDTLDITVHGLPVINSITNNSPLCAGSSLNLSVEASGTNPLTYFWSGPNSFASGQREPSIANIAKEDEGEYVVVVTDGNGCKIDTSTTVVVNSLVIDTISNTGPVFVGEDVTLSVNVSGGIEPYEFNWEGPNGFSSKAADTTITNVSIADSGNYVVNIIDDIGCSVSDTTLVVVLEKVAVPDVRVMNSSYCEGESGADVEVINPQNGVTYEIVDGSGTSYYSVVYDGSIPVIWNVVGNAPPAGTIYRIKAYRAELVSEFELSDTFTVVEYPLPEVDTMTINGKIIPASGDSVVTHCNAGVGYKIGLNSWGPYVYRLYIDGQLQKTKTGDKDPFEFDGYYSTIGTYTIEAVGENGCASLMFGSFTIEGDDLQQFDLSAEDNGGYCEDDADGVELYLEGSENGVEYIVLQDGTPIDTITGDGNRLELGNYIQVGSDTTTYSVIAYSSVGCTYPMNDTVKVYKVPKPSAGTLMAINDNNSLLNGNEYCEGDLGVRLQLSGQEENITYRLYHDGLEVASHVGDASGDDVNFVNNANGSEWFRDAGDYYVVAETNELGCQSDPGNIVTITPVSLPEDRPILGETGFCSGDFTNLFIENTQKDVRYKLIDVIKDLIVDSIDGGNGTTINFPVADSSSYTILATNILTGCQRYFEDTVKVVEYDTPDATLNVEVDIVSVTGDACGSEKAVVSIENPEDGVTYYLWKDGNSTYSSRVTVSVSGLAEVAFPDSIMDNNGHYYIMAENSNGCEVRLQDKPDISTDGAMTVYGLVADDNLCQGDGAAIIETNGSDLGPVVYSLKYRSTGEVYDAIVGTGSKLTFSPPVSANSAFYLEARDTLTGCQVVMDSVNIRFNPLPKAFEMTGSGYYCDSEGGAEIGLSGSEFSVRYYLIEENIGLTDSVEGRYDGGEVSFNLVSTGGTYTVYAKNMDTGCTSSMKDSVKVQFMSSPQPPSVDDDTIYFCSSEAYSEIIINNAEANVTYQLTDADNNIVIEEKTESADDLVLGPVFEGSYMITASYDGSCSVPLADSVRVIEALEPLVTIPDYDAVICYGDSSSVNYDISSDPEDYFEYIVVDANDTTLIWTEEDAVEISSDYIIWKIGRAGTYYIEIRSVASGCSDQTGKIRITVNDEIDVPSISSDTIGICHSATNTSLDLAGQPGKTVFYHLYQASNSAESIDSIYAGVNTITFSNISEGEYLIRSQDIKTGCYSAFTDTIFVRPYISDELQNAYKGIFWEDLVSGIDSIEYMNNGNLTLNLDMEVLDTISKDVFNAYWVNQAENDDVRFGVSDDGEVIISKEGEDYVVSGEYADECPLFRITNRLKIREDNLSVDDIYIYLKEGEFISHQDIKVYYSNIDEGKLSYEFYIDPSLKDMMVEDEGATIKYFTGDYTIVQNNDSASLTFEKGLTFYGNNSDIQIIVKNVEIPSRIDTARVYVFAANKDVDGDKLLFIPNAFSPNGDNINDEFIIETNDKASTVSASLEVYNRWGNLVYRSNNYGDEGKWWDGRANVSNMVTIGDELPNGVYFYIYTVRIVDAEENETPITKKYQGFVELRR
ncbi:T9SS type B sorting domain-containing protein, partial [Thermophagus xiamenensis]|uniref:T9SS type B sorting domain-containing protein n=1 Tax=Thermophagus xiamenensis TaxID=385682 RepID=UPI000255D480